MCTVRDRMPVAVAPHQKMHQYIYISNVATNISTKIHRNDLIVEEMALKENGTHTHTHRMQQRKQ